VAIRKTTADKIEWLTAWLGENPYATFDNAKKAIQEHFGDMLGTGHLQKTVKNFRVQNPPRIPYADTNGKARPPQEPIKAGSPAEELIKEMQAMLALSDGQIPVKEVVSLCKVAMEKLGITAIRINSDGKMTVELKD
jgi:hypothetical protein